MAAKKMSLTPGEALRGQLEKLIGVAKCDFDIADAVNRLDDEDKNDIHTAADWLNANMDFVVADAEYDGRI